MDFILNGGNVLCVGIQNNERVIMQGEKLRKVIVFKWVRNPALVGLEKEVVGEAVFHEWGCDFEEFESGVVNFSTAIVEFPDGTVKNVSVNLVKFVKEATNENS